MPLRVSKAQISVLMFLHTFAQGAYSIPLPTVLKAHGLQDWISVPYLLSAVAAVISPLMFGALADRKFAPERLLGLIAFGASLLMAIASLMIHFELGPAPYLSAMASYHFWAAPGLGLVTSIALASVADPQTDFAPIRVWATIGFMSGAAFVSFGLGLDRSPFSGLVASAVFLVESIFCLTIPATRPALPNKPARIRDYFGWEALSLFKDPDSRMIFICSALYNIPLVAFFPYTLMHLDSLGVQHPSGLMSLAQVSEVAGMFGLASIMGRFRLKWLILTGLVVGLVRYLLYCTNQLPLIVTGIAIHGFVFIFFSMTTQIFLEKRVPPRLRNQAQALLVVMTTGIGGLTGYAFGAWWYRQNLTSGMENWPRFWGVLSLMIVGVAVYFLTGYRGRPKQSELVKEPAPGVRELTAPAANHE